MGTVAASAQQHVQGKYNLIDSADTYAHIVGNGTYSQRSNAHTLDWDGNAWFAGDVYVGADNVKLATIDSVPTKVSQLTNDKGYITSSDIPTVPTKVSQLTNDSGYITSSSIPTKTSQLTNNSGYITSSSVPTKVSQLTNDSKFITSAPYVTDKVTGTPTYLNYSADGMTSTSWIACWDGYTLKGISPSNLNKVLGTSAITQMKTATTTCAYDYSDDNVDWSTGTVTMDWSYKVYSDGTAEAVGVSRNTVPVWTCATWGDLHETGQFRIPSPLNFKDRPHITVGAQAASAWFVSEGVTYGGQCVATYFCRAASSINQYAYITVQINGKLA